MTELMARGGRSTRDDVDGGGDYDGNMVDGDDDGGDAEDEAYDVDDYGDADC